MPTWTDPRWLAGAHEWIHRHAEGLGLGVTGSIEQPHVRPWSTVLRVPTTGGDVWFKANDPLGAHEAGVVSVLAARRPDCVPELLAVDLERGWMLMADGGERLRGIVERERDLSHWFDVLPVYAGLQRDVTQHADELVALGTPDRRLPTLPRQYEDLLDGSKGREWPSSTGYASSRLLCATCARSSRPTASPRRSSTTTSTTARSSCATVA